MNNPFEKDFTGHSLQTLYRKAKTSAFAQFGGAKRLKRHNIYSLWTITFVSVGLIILSLCQAFQIQLNVSNNFFNLFLVALSILVLVLSLLVSTSNLADRSDKMHRCGLELNLLCHEMIPFCKGDESNEIYESFRKRYAQILGSYENYKEIDYAIVSASLYAKGFRGLLWRLWVKICFCFEFVFYPVIFCGLIFIFWRVLHLA